MAPTGTTNLPFTILPLLPEPVLALGQGLGDKIL